MNSQAASPQRLIIGISGASGIIYGIEALKALQSLPVETHLVVSNAAKLTLHHETDMKAAELTALADKNYANSEIGASIASGSYQSLGMLIAPCSIKTMSEIASGVTSSLLSRAADVILKERRTLVLMVRESPLHSGHLETMKKLSDMGAVIAPPVPAFYNKPRNLQDMVQHSVGRCFDLFGIDNTLVKRWEG